MSPYRHRSMPRAALALVLALTPPAVANAKPAAPAKTTLAAVQQTIVVKAAPEAVWEALTRDRGIMTICGYAPTSMAPSRRFERAGDSVPAAAEGASGLLLVTRIDAETRELRVFFEPQEDQALRHTIVRLTPGTGDAGTTVSVLQRSGGGKIDTTDKAARERAAAMTQQLASFRAMVEGR